MVLSNEMEEILEILWVRLEEEKSPSVNWKDIPSDIGDTENLIQELEKDGHITLSRDAIKLTDKGRGEARDVIRRHRLAERLLVDVLEAKEESVEAIACEFEHVLPRGIDDSICTLLGHPRLCPDGNPIPSGRCCTEDREIVNQIISPLSELEPGEEGKIAYMTTKRHRRMQKLMAMGVLPGVAVKLIQSFPSFVLQVEETQIALDKEIAEEIFLRRRRARRQRR
ncbi:MAG: metal-dependent transcriptional regulator [Candidatus Hydrothermarchaeales archaeon]